MTTSIQSDTPIEKKEELIDEIIRKLKSEDPDIPKLIKIFESKLELEKSAATFNQSISENFKVSFWDFIELAIANFLILVLLVTKKIRIKIAEAPRARDTL